MLSKKMESRKRKRRSHKARMLQAPRSRNMFQDTGKEDPLRRSISILILMMMKMNIKIRPLLRKSQPLRWLRCRTKPPKKREARRKERYTRRKIKRLLNLLTMKKPSRQAMRKNKNRTAVTMNITEGDTETTMMTT